MDRRVPECGDRRTGSISFKLAAGRDTAFGDVFMVPKAAFPQSTARTNPQILTIRFVHVRGHAVSGTILPYLAPDCDCWLETRFRGDIRADRIAGEYVSHNSDNGRMVQRRTWWAKRIGPVAAP